MKKAATGKATRLVRPIKFSRGQLFGLCGLLVIIALAIIAVSRAAIPVYRDNWGFWGPRIRACESGNNYKALNGMSTASGGWQILDSTWAGWGGYKRAYLAPNEVQDAKALELFNRRGTQPWDASYACWRLGKNPVTVPIANPTILRNQAPVGSVEAAGCSLSGWAYDPTNNASSISVEIRLDGQSAAVIPAAGLRDDINKLKGITGNHGFIWAVGGKWRDRKPHSYEVAAFDESDSTQRPVVATGQLVCEPANVGDGSGLSGSYFNNAFLNGKPKATRLDPNVNFDWGFRSPEEGIGRDNFSVRWSGKILAQYSETYTFTVRSDDGVRVYVNDELVINQWRHQSVKSFSNNIQLEAGKSYDVIIEYYESRLNAVMKLYWSSYSTPNQIVPTRQLYPANL